MLIICQFPLTDYRSFVDGETGRVPGPTWPLPSEGTEFVRYWGSVRKRTKGGVTGTWIGEERHCIADGAVRIPPTPEAHVLFHDLGARLLFRTFYFDGYAVGKFEIGVNIGKRLPANETVVDAVRRFLALPVDVKDPKTGNIVRRPLASIGGLLASNYLANTTVLNHLPLPEDNDWWVERGGEMLLVELHENEERSIGLNALGEYPGAGDFPSISHHLLDEHNRQIRLWVYRRPKVDGSTAVVRSTCRSLRIALLRVHAEQIALRSVLRQILRKQIPLDGENSGTLLKYLDDATAHILRWEQATSVPVVAIANELDDQASPGERELLLEQVKAMTETITRNITNKVAEVITDEKQQKTGKRTILFLAASPVDVDELRLGREVRDIDEGLRLAENRDLFSLQQQWATRVPDLRRAMLRHKPQIVHFAGHGIEDGILLEDDKGFAKPVGGQALAGFFSNFRTVECIVLNACYSDGQATEIVQKVPFVIGMQNKTPDAGSITFAVALYDAIGAGETYEQAYAIAENALELEGLEQVVLPVLKVRGV